MGQISASSSPKDINNIGLASTIISHARRIMVIGCSGGGKSTLSRILCERLDLPYVSMDREFFWLPGWIKREKASERALIAQKVAEEAWLMDGTGPSTFDLRLPRTDVVIWVRIPRWQCLLGVCARGLRYFGKTRPDMAPGCLEKLPDREFLSYIWHFEKRFVPLIFAGLQQHGPTIPVFQLKSRRQMRALLDLLATPA